MKIRNKPKQFPNEMSFCRMDAGDLLTIWTPSGQPFVAAFGGQLIVVDSNDREALQKFVGISASPVRPCDGRCQKGGTNV